MHSLTFNLSLGQAEVLQQYRNQHETLHAKEQHVYKCPKLSSTLQNSFKGKKRSPDNLQVPDRKAGITKIMCRKSFCVLQHTIRQCSRDWTSVLFWAQVQRNNRHSFDDQTLGPESVLSHARCYLRERSQEQQRPTC